jgi:DNA-binding winged helix-turn-helix (wHTH) protein
MHIVFEECEFDSGRRVLLRHGRLVPLSSRAFQLLELLLERRPEAIAKKELLERLWPDSFVSDASLHNLVTEIRAAVGDDARMARYIRTVPRFGYAFHGAARAAVPARLTAQAESGARLVAGEREWLLCEGANLVGRDHDCSVRIDSATLSRHHARIVVTNGEATIEDLGSKNGTHVNGQRVTQVVSLKDTDDIRLGSVTVTYRIAEPLPSTLTRVERQT